MNQNCLRTLPNFQSRLTSESGINLHNYQGLKKYLSIQRTNLTFLLNIDEFEHFYDWKRMHERLTKLIEQEHSRFRRVIMDLWIRTASELFQNFSGKIVVHQHQVYFRNAIKWRNHILNIGIRELKIRTRLPTMD